jgi:hypothetical protein
MNVVRTAGEFVELVRSMRQYQKACYDEKNSIALKQAKKYEALVDGAIAERDARNAKQTQPDLPGCAP